ncbi:hypothetical protein FGO68_gene16630 [Halteria grandinella]|uniref:PAS domain-containing protein n=1 Tax=Halteria grandinella TaxID=5974 RepID=A0A8J8NHV5_HALGN|nr:hypothetical protein FGO68_gene16630 [Halteria grandinella]
MPLFDIIIRTMVATQRYSICGLTLILFSLFMVFLVRIFNVCVPTEMIPWCAPISKLVFLNLLIKAGLVLCNAFDINGDYALYEVLLFFGLQGFQASYRVLFAPNYIKEIDLFIKTKDFAVCLIFFIGIICKVVNDQTNYDIVYFIIFIPIVTVGWIMFEIFRKQQILFKVKTKSIKLEVENEFALYVMMTLVRDCLIDNAGSQKVFGQLMDLMIAHIEDCNDPYCICDEMENFYELLRLKQLHNQEVFPLLRTERKRYKKIIDDQGLIGTISCITDVTLKTAASESTVQKDQHDQNNLDRHGENENDTQNEEAMQAQEEKQQIQQQANKKKKPRTVYKINMDETKHRFLSELLYLFYFEMIKKFPNSFKIQLLSNYFALLYKQKEMLCVFQMRSFNKQRLSKLDQCCHQINEQYLLYEIQKIQRANQHVQSNIQEGNFNGDYFIKMNQLYRNLNETIESLSSYVVSFWKIFERPQLEVEATHEIGTKISKNIQNVFRYFNELDTLKIFKDYQMYFQFAIVQLHILNDPVAYELYIGKMRSILEINKVYQKNFTQSGGNANVDQANFIIVDANGAKFGNIIQVNNGLRLLLGWTEEDAKRFRIENFMPDLIRNRHQEFMNRYNKTGQSYIINNKVTMFVKKTNGYVIPVELYIKFHYSIDYQYTFLAIVKPFYEMAPFSNGVKYNINQLLFLIVDNESDGRITEYSESCAKLLSMYGFGAELGQNEIVKRITDIAVELDFPKFKSMRQDRYQTNEIFENVLKLDLNQFDDSNSMSHEHNKKTGNLLTSLLLNNGGIVSAKTRIFEERYSGGVLDMNIFCFGFINDQDGGGSILKVESSNGGRSIVHSSNAQKEEEELKNVDEDDRDQSMSATGSSTSSTKDSTASMAEFRNFHSFTEQATPKTLTLIIRLIVALYFIMVIIAAVNLGINISRQMQSETDVHAVRQAFDRINWISMNQLLVRVLLNIANGYEPERSILIEDRFNRYSTLQEDRVTQLKNTQSLLQLSSFTSTEEFKRFREDKIVPLYYLSESNQIYTKYESLNIAFNLYIAKLTEMNSFTKEQLRGHLSIQTLNSRQDAFYKPSYYEQTIFFIVQNGNKELRQFAIDACTYYGRESEQHAEQNITSTKVTAIISIIVIVIIGLVIAPILTTAEIRKYKALLYFLKIPRDKFPDLIKNCEYCLNMNDERRYYQILKDYENFLGIKLINQQVEQLRQAKDEKNNIDNQSSKIDNSSGPRSSTGISGVYLNNTETHNESIDQMVMSGAGMNSIVSQDLNSVRGKKSHHREQSQSMSIQPRSEIMREIGGQGGASVSEVREEDEEDGDMMDHNNERDNDVDMDHKEGEDVNNNKFVLGNLNLKANKNDDKVHKKHQEDMTQQEIDVENHLKDHPFRDASQIRPH